MASVMSVADVARKYNVSYKKVYYISRGTTYSYIAI